MSEMVRIAVSEQFRHPEQIGLDSIYDLTTDANSIELVSDLVHHCILVSALRRHHHQCYCLCQALSLQMYHHLIHHLIRLHILVSALDQHHHQCHL